MPARPRRVALPLLVAGWALSAWLAPAFVPFARDRLHDGCWWVTRPAPAGWYCVPDAIPFEILSATEAVLLLVAAPALLAAGICGGGPAGRRGRVGSTILLALALLPAAYGIFCTVCAAVQLDPTGASVQHLDGLWFLTAGPAVGLAATGATAVALLGSIRARGAGAAAAACIAWAVVPIVEPGLAWLVPLCIALAVSAVLLAPPATPARLLPWAPWRRPHPASSPASRASG